ncbi:spastin-like [Rhopilema esculentum]|uniref:spastin-like n=1 Tax=Rhopilema esculentum TaxID=499914 RepID=UPI0031D01BD4
MPASVIPMTSSPGTGPARRPPFRLSRSLSADPDIPVHVLTVRHHHAAAYKHISEALKIDEEGGDQEAKLKAIGLYNLGVRELVNGIGIQLNGEGSEWDRARNLQTKMESNLRYCTSRLEELNAVVESYQNSVNQANITKKLSPNSPRKSSIRKSSIDVSEIMQRIERSPEKRKPSLPSPRILGAKDAKPDDLRKQLTRGHKATSPKLDKLRSNAGNLSPRGHSTTSKVKRTQTLPNRPVAKARQVPAQRGKQAPKPPEDHKSKISNLKNVDNKMANMILNEVVEKGPGVSFNDIGGIDNAKRILKEIVILPTIRPELFTGLRAPAKGVLLFGPPGNGKTLLAKAVATEAQSVFFNISVASLTSKWMGESEKLVRAMFAVARELQPAIVFMDEVDSILKERSESEHESSRRLKTEFLVSFDGVMSDTADRILIMAATNRPWELDDAALRRFVKRVYVPLPDFNTRKQILEKLLVKEGSPLHSYELDRVARETEGYSGSDLAALARESALMPLREVDCELLKSLPADKVRKLKVEDLLKSMDAIRPSVSKASIKQFEDWNKLYGSL